MRATGGWFDTTGKGVKTFMDQAVSVCGRLKVGETRENGCLVGSDELHGEKRTGPLDLSAYRSGSGAGSFAS